MKGGDIEVEYEGIEGAIRLAKHVLRSSSDHDGNAMEWHPVKRDVESAGVAGIRAWHPSRYRIDGEEVWPVQDTGRVDDRQPMGYGHSQMEIIEPDIQMMKMMEEIQYQNRMILQAFATPRMILKTGVEQEEKK